MKTALDLDIVVRLEAAANFVLDEPWMERLFNAAAKEIKDLREELEKAPNKLLGGWG